MQIQVTYTSVDHVRQARKFKTIKSARAFAEKWVGPQDAEGGSYAVSNDGVGKVTWTGCTREELFGEPRPELTTKTTFYRKGEDLFVREAGRLVGLEGEKFAQVFVAYDIHTGCMEDGWCLRDTTALCLFDSSVHFETRDAALAFAKHVWLDYIAYCEQEAQGDIRRYDD